STAAEDREDRRALQSSPIDPMEMARMAQTMVAGSPGLSEDVRDLISAARQAVGVDARPGQPLPGGGGAAGVAPATSEPVYVPRWQAPQLGRSSRATIPNARRRVAAVVDSLTAYLGLHARMAKTANRAFNGVEIKIGDYARQAKISQ